MTNSLHIISPLFTAEVDLPIQKGTLRAYKSSNTFYYLESKSGVQIICERNLLGCDVIISGFYRGQLRGLFGK